MLFKPLLFDFAVIVFSVAAAANIIVFVGADIFVAVADAFVASALFVQFVVVLLLFLFLLLPRFLEVV